MKAIEFEKYGPPEVMQLREVEKPNPRDNEVLIKTRAATVVLGDCEARSFAFPLWLWLPLRIIMGIRKPKRKILGQELAGEIEAVGGEVKRFKRGDPVFATTGIRFGAYAEYACLPETGGISIKPANMTFEEAATVPTGGLNALHFVRKGMIQKGDRVLINGACGNIGSFAVQLARNLGAEVTAVDRGDKLDVLREIGADHVIDYTQEDFTMSGVVYDVIFDVVGKSSYSRSLTVLRKDGHYLLANPRFFHMLRGLWTSKTSSKKVIFEFASDKSEDLLYLKELIEAGKLRSVVDQIYPLEETAEAHRYVEAGHKKGNVAITISHNGPT